MDVNCVLKATLYTFKLSVSNQDPEASPLPQGSLTISSYCKERLSRRTL